jgi:hypothetical protein
MEPTDEEAQPATVSLPGGEEALDCTSVGGPSLPKSGDDPVPLRDEDLETLLLWAIEKLRPLARGYMGVDPNG